MVRALGKERISKILEKLPELTDRDILDFLFMNAIKHDFGMSTSDEDTYIKNLINIIEVIQKRNKEKKY